MDYLTKIEINKILKESKNSKYERANLIFLGSQKLSIRGITKNPKVVLIYGNDKFGYKHIFDRHSPTSKKAYWSKNKLENPSKFSFEIAPLEYAWLASKIFKPENITLEKNYNPEIFDKYVGKYGNENLKETEYTLITYKNTGIIHTFYLSANKKDFNKKKILNFQEGHVSTSYDLGAEVQTHQKPYFDNDGIQRFKIILRVFEKELKEKWYFQINTKEGEPIQTNLIEENNVKECFKAPFRMSVINYAPLTKFEKEIKKYLINNSS